MLHAPLLIGHIDARGQSTQNRMEREDTDGGEQHIVDCIACLLRTQHAGIIIIILEHCCSLLVLAQRLLLGRCSNPLSNCVYRGIDTDRAGRRTKPVKDIKTHHKCFSNPCPLLRGDSTECNILLGICVRLVNGDRMKFCLHRGKGKEHDPSGYTFSSIGSRFCGGCRWILVSGFMLSSKSNSSSSPSDTTVVVVFSSFAYKKRQSHSLSVWLVCLLKGLSCSSSLPLSVDNNIHHLPRFVSQTGFALFSVINLN